jgi:phosphotransferase system HPr (HPr) family protein
MIRETITVLKEGTTGVELNALCNQLSNFECRVYIEMPNQRVNAKSLMGLISFEFSTGDKLTLRAEGREEEKAIKVLKGFFC